MTINDTHDWLDFILKKTRTGFFSREQKDNALHKAQLGVFATYFAEFLQTQYVHEALKPFRETGTLTTNSTGFVAYPSGYEHATGIMVSYYDNITQQNDVNGLRIYKEDELPDALKSQIRPVTYTSPIGTLRKTGIQVYPKNAIYTLEISYLSTPVKPVYGYTVSGIVETYDPSTSTHLQWADTYIMPVLMRTLEYLGVNMQDPNVVQYANEKTMQTVTSPIKS
jgi:hypothetical protein